MAVRPIRLAHADVGGAVNNALAGFQMGRQVRDKRIQQQQDAAKREGVRRSIGAAISGDQNALRELLQAAPEIGLRVGNALRQQQNADRTFDRQERRDQVSDSQFSQQFDFRKQRAAAGDARADRAFNANQSDGKFNRSIAMRRLSIAEKQAAKTSDPNAILSVRQQAAESVGLDQSSPEYKAYILTGRLPKPSPQAKASKTTVDNAKASGFARRAIDSNKVIRKPESVAAATSVAQRAAAFIPVIGNFLVDPNFQKFDQAQRDFINAQLRRESGAVISDAEFDNAEKQYFPQPGDRAEVIEQKSRNRQNAIAGLVESAGPLGSQFQENAPQTQGEFSEGATARNPQTGDKIIFQNGQWRPIQ